MIRRTTDFMNWHDRGVVWLLAGALLGLTACGTPASPPAPQPMTLEEVDESENLIEGLRPQIAALSKGVLNLHFPDAQSRYVFEPEVAVTDLAASAPQAWTPVLDLAVRQANWPVGSRQAGVDREALALWREFLDTVDFFHHFNLHNDRDTGQFADRIG